MTQVTITLKPGAFLPIGKERIWWRVLDVNREAETALLIAERLVSRRAYNKERKAVTWETCDLRKWLNGEYYEKSFTEDEKNAIIETKIHTPDNPDQGTPGGNDTNDRIFLLSVEEVAKYFKNSKESAMGNASWVLRSPSLSNDMVTFVGSGSGKIVDYCSRVDQVQDIRPALSIDLRSGLLKKFNLLESPESITVQVPSLTISENTLWDVYPGETSIEIPEGVSVISGSCFAGNKQINTVRIPSTLREVGSEAFAFCENLSVIYGHLGPINYGKDAFKGCNKLNYTKEMFRTTGKLCDSFCEHLNNCGPEELAMAWMYQTGKRWKEELSKHVTSENAEFILASMTKYIQEKEKAIKKPAEAAAEFVKDNIKWLSKERVQDFFGVLEKGKMTALSEKTKEDPSINGLMGGERKLSSGEQVCLDGSILYGSLLQKLEPGADIVMGNEPMLWRILELDRKNETALVIADRPVCARTYHEKREDATWENCDLRKWLNGEYYETAFSEEEKSAIVGTDPKNPEYKTSGGNDMKDRIFLLSVTEARRYFKNDQDREIGKWWWLRSRSFYASCVTSSGRIETYGCNVNNSHAVRPAFRINLKSEFFQSLTQKEKGEAMISAPELIIQNGAIISAIRTLKAVKLPSYVKRIESGAFCNCAKLETVTWDGEDPVIIEDSFINCPKLLIAFSRKPLPASLADSTRRMNKEEIAWILLYQTGKTWRKNGIKAAKKLDPVLVFQKQLSLIKELKKIPSPVASNLLDVCKEFCAVLPVELIKEFAEVLETRKCAKQLLSMQEDLTLREKMLGEESLKGLPVIECRVKEYLDKECLTQKELGERLNLMMGIKPAELPCVEDVDGNTCSPNVLSWLLTAHETTEMIHGCVETVPAWKRPGIRREALTVIELLKPDSLQAAINSLAEEYLIKYQNTRKKYLVFPFCRYADEESMSALTNRAPKWATSASGKNASPLLQLRSAINYSNTRAAMLFAERYKALDEYAKLRGTDVDTLLNTVLSEFDLDETGKKRYELGNTVLETVLQDDLTISLYDQGAQKIVKSVPKKNSDPEKYEAAKADLADIRKNIKTVAKARNNVLFEDFLTGKNYEANKWKKIHFSNPVLNRIARLLVWEQEASTFTLSAEGAIDNAGQAYKITSKPIRLAHPMEMARADVDAWQKYYTSHGLKQPFAQVWEPVIDSNSIRKDRYSGIVLPLYTFKGRDKHGIIGSGFNYYSEDFEVRFKDCDLELETSTWRLESLEYDAYTYTLGKFSYKKYTRYTNHIVGILDGWTIEQRILKDDVSVVDRLESFTLAQITEFIKKASEHNCNNVTAALLEYKNKRFTGYDPMERFWLEDF